MSIKWGCEKEHEIAKTNYSTYTIITDNGSDRRGFNSYNRGFCKICSSKIYYKMELQTAEDLARESNPLGLFEKARQRTVALLPRFIRTSG